MVEYSPGGLIGLRLLRGDDPIDVAAKLRDVSCDDVVIRVGNDAELESHAFEVAERCDDLRKGRIFEMLDVRRSLSPGL
jgi:hypothetical protein